MGVQLDPLFELSTGHPRRAMLAAHCLWTATPAGATADGVSWAGALDDLRRRTRRDCEALWDRLADSDRRTLRAIAHHRSPYAKDVTNSPGLARSTAQSAIVRLVRSGDLERVDDGLHFVVPALADWVRWRFPR